MRPAPFGDQNRRFTNCGASPKPPKDNHRGLSLRTREPPGRVADLHAGRMYVWEAPLGASPAESSAPPPKDNHRGRPCEPAKPLGRVAGSTCGARVRAPCGTKRSARRRFSELYPSNARLKGLLRTYSPGFDSASSRMAITVRRGRIYASRAVRCDQRRAVHELSGIPEAAKGQPQGVVPTNPRTPWPRCRPAIGAHVCVGSAPRRFTCGIIRAAAKGQPQRGVPANPRNLLAALPIYTRGAYMRPLRNKTTCPQAIFGIVSVERPPQGIVADIFPRIRFRVVPDGDNRS